MDHYGLLLRLLLLLFNYVSAWWCLLLKYKSGLRCLLLRLLLKNESGLCCLLLRLLLEYVSDWWRGKNG